mgnify:CR=1 FL=1|jgi:hypothetical protein
MRLPQWFHPTLYVCTQPVPSRVYVCTALALPIFHRGGGRTAEALALYMHSLHYTADTATIAP